MGVGEWADIVLVYRTISLSSEQLHASTDLFKQINVEAVQHYYD